MKKLAIEWIDYDFENSCGIALIVDDNDKKYRRAKPINKPFEEVTKEDALNKIIEIAKEMLEMNDEEAAKNYNKNYCSPEE